MKADVIFRNADIVDGTGASRVSGSVAVTDDRIVAIGDLNDWHAATEFEARGHVLAPGFIDPHVHHDEAVVTSPLMECAISQGVTSIINGNCGFSIAPLTAEGPFPSPLDLIVDHKRPRFERYRDYRTYLAGHPPAVNTACLIGHGTLRINTVADLSQPADKTELSTMRTALDHALSEGGIGVSTGAFYPPAQAAPTSELVEMAQIARDHGKLYVTHMRDEGDHLIEALQETLDIGQTACCGVHVSHHKCAGLANHGLSDVSLQMIRDALTRQDVGLDTTPWTASSTMLNSGRHRQASKVLISASEPFPELAGRDLAEVAAEWGVDLDTAVERLLPAAGIFFIMDEDDVQQILAFEHTIVCSDAIATGSHPHPRAWGTFPRVLRRYVREIGLLTLEEAIRRMTSMPADRFGIKDRGRIEVGAFADLVLFDAEKVGERSTYEKPVAPAQGITRVMVNGRFVWADGEATGARPGRHIDREKETRVV